MRIERVSVGAFGPLTGATLDLASGLTIIYGPNESGKSSWHAALYVGLCGVRRSRGRGTSEDQLLEALHKPWNGTRWEVGTTLLLEDGRRVELHYELARRVDCYARDTVLGRDISNEIMDGMPDGSRWLGLDRRSFLATACIQQTDLLGILSNPGLLQEHMQRAAATAGADATAAAAIARLEEFKRERVGADVAHSRKPLRMAKNAQEAAEGELRRAREAHDRFSELAARADRAHMRAAESEHAFRVLKAAVDRSRLAQLEQRLARAKELAWHFPDGPPAGLAAEDQMVNQVAAAIQAWEQAPPSVELAGPSSQEIRRELEALPQVPPGDLEPDPDVVAARERLQLSEQAIELLGETPAETATPPTGGLSEQKLLEMARDLEIPEPSVDPALQADVRELQAAVVAASRPHLVRAWLAAAGIAAAAGLTMLLVGVPVLGVLALGAAAATGAWALARRSVSSRAELQAVNKLRQAEASLGEDRFRIEQTQARRAVALREVAAVGLQADPVALRRTAEELVAADRAQKEVGQWKAKTADAAATYKTAACQLETALRHRSAEVQDDLRVAYNDYVAACRERTRLASEAGKRPQVEAALRARLDLESAAAKADRIRSDAKALITTAAARVGESAVSEKAAKEALKRWQAHHATEVVAAELAVREWTELEGILDGHSLEEYEGDVNSRRDAVAEEADSLDPAEIDATVFEDEGRQELAAMRRRAQEERSEADRLAGSVEAEAKTLPSVAEAEERFEAAKRESARVQSLHSTLDQTLEFLRAAQEVVHRDIAPVLNETLRRWLPELTSGRYVDAAVDPASLDVQVLTITGKWRTAKYLSQGTREQVYLLLRVALAQHLTSRNEVIPLILDDVTVQCDASRTCRLLEILHKISKERQVVLFAQDEEVLLWARSNLNQERDQLIELDPAAVQA